MNNTKKIKEAIEQFKDYRNHAQAVSDSQLNLISIILDKVHEILSIPSNQRTGEQNGILELYMTLTESINASLEASDKYNKSLAKYIKGFNTLTKMASSENENQ